MAEHKRAEFVQFSRKELEELACFAAKTRLIGNLYVGAIGEQQTKWNEDGGIEVITHHTPSSLERASEVANDR